MTIKPGTLVYDKESGRYDIRSGLNEYYGGLHCGQSFEVFDGKHWKPPLSLSSAYSPMLASSPSNGMISQEAVTRSAGWYCGNRQNR